METHSVKILGIELVPRRSVDTRAQNIKDVDPATIKPNGIGIIREQVLLDLENELGVKLQYDVAPAFRKYLQAETIYQNKLNKIEAARPESIEVSVDIAAKTLEITEESLEQWCALIGSAQREFISVVA